MHADALGCMWMHVDARDARGHTRAQVDTRGHTWTRVETRGDVWTRVDICGHTWTHVVARGLRGYRRMRVVARQCTRTHVDAC